MKYEAWGWKVIQINGNDVNEIRKALKEAKAEISKPTLIIGNTVMGKGAVGADNSCYENKVSTTDNLYPRQELPSQIRSRT